MCPTATPNLLNTLKTYDATAGNLRDVSLTQDDVDKIIIGVIGQMDSYQLPDAKGFTSLVRHLTGYDDDLRQRLRDEVLATTWTTCTPSPVCWTRWHAPARWPCWVRPRLSPPPTTASTRSWP